MKGASWLAKTTMVRIVPSLQLARTDDSCYTLHLHLHFHSSIENFSAHNILRTALFSAASPAERLRSAGSLAITKTQLATGHLKWVTLSKIGNEMPQCPEARSVCSFSYHQTSHVVGWRHKTTTCLSLGSFLRFVLARKEIRDLARIRWRRRRRRLSKNVLNMLRMLLFPNRNTKNSRRGSRSPDNAEFLSFHVAVLQRTTKKCTKNYNARAQPLFCSLNLLLVTFSLVVSSFQVHGA